MNLFFLFTVKSRVIVDKNRLDLSSTYHSQSKQDKRLMYLKVYIFV